MQNSDSFSNFKPSMYEAYLWFKKQLQLETNIKLVERVNKNLHTDLNDILNNTYLNCLKLELEKRAIDTSLAYNQKDSLRANFPVVLINQKLWGIHDLSDQEVEMLLINYLNKVNHQNDSPAPVLITKDKHKIVIKITKTQKIQIIKNLDFVKTLYS